VRHVEELRELGDDELYSRMVEAKQELFNLRFQHVTGQLDNHTRLSQVRREVARTLTILREREIEAAERAANPDAATPVAPEPEDDTRRRRRRDRVAASRKAEAEAAAAAEAGPNQDGDTEAAEDTEGAEESSG
jgi:large subunit ribosomal protein L29